MRNKGLILFFTILIALTCLYCLSFTYVTKNIEGDAQAVATGVKDDASKKIHDEAVKGAIASFEENNGGQKATARDIKRITAEVENSLERDYLDNMKDSSIYLGFTYGESKYKEINLGLDLQGGMSVTLALATPQLVEQLMGDVDETSPIYAPFKAAKEKYNNGASGSDFLDILASQPDIKSGKIKLSTYLGNALDKKNANNEAIIEALKEKRTNTMDKTYEILRTRIDRYGVSQPNIQTDAAGRILVELPGVKDKKRVEDLLKSTAQLEFWKVYTVYAGGINTFPERFKQAALTAAKIAKEDENEQAAKDLEKIASTCANSPDNLAVGVWAQGDTTLVGKYRSHILAQLEGEDQNIVLYWEKADKKTKKLALVPLHIESEECGPVLCNKTISEGEAIIRKAEQNVDEYNRIIVNMTMEDEAADQWQRITKAAIDTKSPVNIAIVLDEMIYSYPTIQSEIANGRSVISGNFDIQEAKELAIVLNSGGLDVDLDIISSDLIGPTLGQKSINSGMLS